MRPSPSTRFDQPRSDTERQSREPSTLRRREAAPPHLRRWLAPLSILAIALAIRLVHAARNPVDIDELGQIAVASMSLPAMLDGIATHYSPPLDYLITAALLRLGVDSVEALRLPAVLSGTAAVALHHRLALAVLRSYSAALMAAMLMALAPLAVQHAAWVRMYSLYLLLATASLLALVEHQRTRDGRWLAAWLVTGLLLIYTHYFAALLLASQMAWLLALGLWPRHAKPADRRADTRAAVLMGAVLVVGFLPWAGIALSQAETSQGVMPWGAPSPAVLLGKQFLAVSSGGEVGDSRALGGAISLAYGALALGGFTRLWRHRRSAATLFAVVGLAPLLLLLAGYTVVVGPITTTRNLIFLLPPWLVLVAAGLWLASQRLGRGLRRRSLPRASWTGVALAAALAAPGLATVLAHTPAGLDAMAEHVKTHAKPGDAVMPLGLPSGYLDVLYPGYPEMAPPTTVGGFAQAVREAAGAGGVSCLWIVWSGHDNLYWSVGEAPDAATAALFDRNRQVTADALSTWATLRLETTAIGSVPPAGVYRACGAG